jgi:FkbM family methyltransferase
MRAPLATLLAVGVCALTCLVMIARISRIAQPPPSRVDPPPAGAAEELDVPSSVPPAIPWKNLNKEEHAFRDATPSQLGDVWYMRDAVWETPDDDRYFSLQDELERYINRTYNRRPRALIIGANNGVLVDRLTPIIIAHEWDAVLIEAVPQLFVELQANFYKKLGHAWPGLHLLNIAVSASEAITSMELSVNLDPDAVAWMKGTGQDAARRHGGKPVTEPGRTLVKVPAAPLRRILKGFPPFDIVQIDIEGADEEVMMQMEGMGMKPLVVVPESCAHLCDQYRIAHDFDGFRIPGSIVLFDKRALVNMGEPRV